MLWSLMGRSSALRPVAMSARRAARYIRDRTRRSEGVPAGLDFETLDALCREHGRGGLKRCAHLCLSSGGWTARGVYRLELLTEAGTSWRLIFKDECFGPELAPALEGLPACPGPPEAIVYRIQDPFLSPFLPRLFWLREIEPGRHFKYILEDIAPTHAELQPGTLRHVKVARGPAQVQHALRRAFAGKQPDGLIRYDRRYSERLLEYAGRSLADYAARTADGSVAALWDRWHDVTSVHQRDEFYDDDLRVPIHGDFHKSNIHAHRHDGSQLKVLDWEWAGIGLPHADLASLATSLRREDHPALLQAIVEEDRRLEADQHRRLFHWCQLERRLFSAAFRARQQLRSARRTPWVERNISLSAERALAAMECLRARQTRSVA